MERNRQFDIMLAIGIIMVVMGHNHQPPYLFFPAYTFQVALFFFISGYFFKIQPDFSGKAKWYFKKIKTQLLPYFALNIVFTAITFLLSFKNIRFGTISWHNFFVTPFVSGHQYSLFIPAWFLLQLFIINIIAQTIYLKNNFKHKLIISALLAPASMFLLSGGLGKILNPDLNLFITRTFFGLLIFSAGCLFKETEHKLKKIIVNPLSAVFLFIVINILYVNFGKIDYSIVWGKIGNPLAIITSLLIILIVYIISYYISLAISDKSVFLAIGRNTYSIMVWHLSVFFLINCLLYILGFFPVEKLSNVYFAYKPDKLWFIYQIPAIIIPIFMAVAYRKLKSKIIK